MKAKTYEEYLNRREMLTGDIVHAQKKLDGAREHVDEIGERYQTAPENERPELDRESIAAQRDVRSWEDVRDGAIQARSQYDLENHEFDDARERGEQPPAVPEPVDPLTRLHQFTSVVGIVAHMSPNLPPGIPADHPALWQAPPARYREIEIPNADETAEHVKTKSIPSEPDAVKEDLAREMEEATQGHEPAPERRDGHAPYTDREDEPDGRGESDNARSPANDNNPQTANDNNPRAAANDNGPRTPSSVPPPMPNPDPPAATIAASQPPANDNKPKGPDDPHH